MTGVTRKDDWQAVQDSFYDAADKHSHLAYNPESAYALDLTDHLRAAIHLSSSDRVLEIGAGAGRFSLHLAPRCGALVALDTSAALLDALHRHPSAGDSLQTVCASVFDLPGPLDPSTFDAVCGFFILHHLPDHDVLFRLLHQMLKPGGRLAFVEPNRLNPSFLVQVAISPEMQWEAEKGMFTFSAGRTVRLLRELGYTNVRRTWFGFFPPQILDRAPGFLRLQEGFEKIPLLRRMLPFVLITAERS